MLLSAFADIWQYVCSWCVSVTLDWGSSAVFNLYFWVLGFFPGMLHVVDSCVGIVVVVLVVRCFPRWADLLSSTMELLLCSSCILNRVFHAPCGSMCWQCVGGGTVLSLLSWCRSCQLIVVRHYGAAAVLLYIHRPPTVHSPASDDTRPASHSGTPQSQKVIATVRWCFSHQWLKDWTGI